jgi:single-stranded DNA-binding protein
MAISTAEFRVRGFVQSHRVVSYTNGDGQDQSGLLVVIRVPKVLARDEDGRPIAWTGVFFPVFLRAPLADRYADRFDKGSLVEVVGRLGQYRRDEKSFPEIRLYADQFTVFDLRGSAGGSGDSDVDQDAVREIEELDEVGDAEVTEYTVAEPVNDDPFDVP